MISRCSAPKGRCGSTTSGRGGRQGARPVADYPEVHCNRDDVCVLTTGMGHANVAALLMALTFFDRFDLRRTYFSSWQASRASIRRAVARFGGLGEVSG